MLSVIILAAGQGTRMCSSLPKVLHPLGGKEIIHHAIDAAKSLSPRNIILVLSPFLASRDFGKGVSISIQSQPKGTGDAVLAAFSRISNLEDDVLILCGDAPLIQEETLKAILDERKVFPNDVLVVGMRPKDLRAYGRLVVNQENIVERIVEFKDASDSERNITLCNSGVYLLKASLLKGLLEKITPDNEAGEYYLTDIVALAKENGVCTRVIEGPAEELLGINTRVELAAAEQVLQNRWRNKWMLKGVTLQDPESVFFCHDTILGQDVVIGAHVTFGPGVVIEDHVQILPYCHMEGAVLRRGACVGPFAHLRSGTEVGEQAIIGNFVEVKNSILAPRAKAKHLSYLGNAQIGERANIGAGTITCNYNGYVKAQTTIGAYAFIGSNSSLVAPVSIGERAIVAAGSVITKDVPADSLGIQRTPQQNKENWAIGFRNQQVNNKQAG